MAGQYHFPVGLFSGGAAPSVSSPISRTSSTLLPSCADYMVYTRGSKEDFDRFARVADDERWSWNNLLPYMRKVCCPIMPLNFSEPLWIHRMRNSHSLQTITIQK